MAGSSRKVLKLLALVLVPAIFGILGYLILYFGFRPVWSVVSAAGAMLSVDNAPNFVPGLKDIYDTDEGRNREGQHTAAPVGTETENAVQPTPSLPAETPEPSADPSETAPAPTPSHRPWLHHDGPLNIRDIVVPEFGTRYGHLYGFRIGLNAPVYYGDSNVILRYGVGQYRGSFTPGFGRLILLSGHNTTFFKCLRNIQEGDEIIFDTNYETYKYRIYRVEVMESSTLSALLESKYYLDPHETLIMYTCYPFHAIVGTKHQRLVVFGERIEGCDIIWR